MKKIFSSYTLDLSKLGSKKREIIYFLLSLLTVFLIMNGATALYYENWSDVWRLPLELVGAVFLLALCPRYTTRYAVIALASVTYVFIALLSMNYLMQATMGRELNILLDLHLIDPMINVMSGSFGGMETLGMVSVFIFANLLALAVLYLTYRQISKTLAHSKRRYVLLSMSLPLLVGWAWVNEANTARFLSHHLVDEAERQVHLSIAMYEEAPILRREAGYDDGADAASLQKTLGGADVFVFFVESYGQEALDNHTYSKITRPALQKLDETLAQKAIPSISGWLRSPTIGGQSWLAHGSFQSGLWLNDQLRYNLFIKEGLRRPLSSYFREIGYRTLLVMPAITEPWPESAFFGFDETYFARDIPYKGPEYNWVTMPDQYTLSFFEKVTTRERLQNRSQPIFAQIALISSHAPWTPIAGVVDDWDQIGGGEIFEKWSDNGPTPEALWSNPDDVRKNYARSIEYVFHTFASYFAQKTFEKPTLIMILGDHEAGTIISGASPSRNVPIHILASDQKLLSPFMAAGFKPGLIPDATSKQMRMNEVRQLFFSNSSGLAPTGSLSLFRQTEPEN